MVARSLQINHWYYWNDVKRNSYSYVMQPKNEQYFQQTGDLFTHTTHNLPIRRNIDSNNVAGLGHPWRCLVHRPVLLRVVSARAVDAILLNLNHNAFGKAKISGN